MGSIDLRTDGETVFFLTDLYIYLFNIEANRCKNLQRDWFSLADLYIYLVNIEIMYFFRLIFTSINARLL